MCVIVREFTFFPRHPQAFCDLFDVCSVNKYSRAAVRTLCHGVFSAICPFPQRGLTASLKESFGHPKGTKLEAERGLNGSRKDSFRKPEGTLLRGGSVPFGMWGRIPCLRVCAVSPRCLLPLGIVPRFFGVLSDKLYLCKRERKTPQTCECDKGQRIVINISNRERKSAL